VVNVRKFGYILFIPIVFILLWANFQIFLSLGANGYFYHICSPAKVERISEEEVSVHFVRESRISMQGKNICELHCEREVINIPHMDVYLEKGEASFYKTYFIPNSAEGICHYECLINYSPFGMWGATLGHSYYTEDFVISK